MSTTSTPRELTAEILRHALVVAAEEASIVVVRSAYSTFIVEGSDASAAIFDAAGRLIAQSTATSLAHSASIRLCLRAVLEDIPLAGMAPGDVYVMNDSYRGGIHANDLAVVQPVFVDGAVGYFTGTLIHVSDVGGSSAGGMHATATDIFQEGLQLPPVKLADASGLRADIARIIALNSRTPDAVLGDVHALMAGTTVARRRMEALLDEHGTVGLARGVEDYLAYAERLVRRELAGLPPGTYRGTYRIDNDGIDLERSHRIEVAVVVDGDRAVVDFAGTSPQVAAAINCSLSQTVSGAIYGLRCFLDPTIPMNEGFLAPFDVRVPSGSLLNPVPPAPTGGRFVCLYAVIDAIIDALSKARPERGMAASGILTPFTVSAPASAAVHWAHMAYDFGGVGARRGKDGPNCTGLHFGIGRNTIPQVEPVEQRCPLIVEGVEVIADSGGAGRWRGGAGSRTTFLVLEDAVVTMRCDRYRFPPPGVDGGRPGRPGGYYLVHADGTRVRLPDKAANVACPAGARFVVETSGGGGVGDPAGRPREHVRADLEAGVITADGAAVYGCVLSADPGQREPHQVGNVSAASRPPPRDPLP
jgi:N-methylhydantoinase B